MPFMTLRAAHIALAAGAAFGASQALAASEIVRCVDERGAITYQHIACPATTVTERSGIPTEFPAPNLLERDRLFAREAALDRRLEARRDRELQEAQMREARAEREAERERAAAMLAAAQAAQPQYLLAYPLVRHWAPGQRRIAPPGVTRNQSIFR